MRNVQIGDGHEVQVLFAQVRDEGGKVGKAFRVDGKGTISVLVVDVEIKNVGGNFVGAQTIRDFARLRFRKVTVTRLLKTQCPQRRQGRLAGEVGVAFDHLFRRRAINEVVVERAAL